MKTKLFSTYEQKLKDQIQNLTNKLNNDPDLTESQYKTIEGILQRKQAALKEGRVF